MSSEPHNLQDQDIINFSDVHISATDSDADKDDDQPYFREVKEAVLKR
jgi:hypothetical protein